MSKNIIIGIVIGVMALGGARFFWAPLEQTTHYHANWAVYIDDVRLDLSSDKYMEDVSSNCYGSDGLVSPESRVHMHLGEQDVVHIHHAGATWGHLLMNLGFGVGEGFMVRPDGTILSDNKDERFTYVLNGQILTSIHNQLISSTDRLLISYGAGSIDSVLENQFTEVMSDAIEYNDKADPATCSGGHQPLSLSERLKMAFWS
ncbi:uncharacterized protein METZ01_LOCUS102531 [marine metagenome]|uniref:Uncharacterized protein n=1 Tax=marine metagenome TaxID=408172 RepID=A0A381WCJ6_9ZZZZ